MERADPQADLDKAASIGAPFIVSGDEEWPANLGVLARAAALDTWNVPVQHQHLGAAERLVRSDLGPIASVRTWRCSPHPEIR
jgi:hypothetical protein